MSSGPALLREVCNNVWVDMNLVKRLVEAGVDINAKDDSGNTALHYASRSTGNGVIAVWYLVDKGADVSAINDSKSTPLMTACGADYPTAVKQLILLGADVNAKGFRGETPLMIAAMSAWNSTCVNMLVEAGADVNAAMPDGTTPLIAAFMGSLAVPDVVEILIQNGADVNAQRFGEYGCTPLTLSGKMPPEIVKLMIEKGADVNASNNRGETPLMKHSYYKSYENIKLLKAAGAKR